MSTTPVEARLCSVSLSSDIVREILTLAQGLDGKFIAFHPITPFQFITTSNGAVLDANVLRFLKRIANVGQYYQSVKSYYDLFKYEPADAFSPFWHSFHAALGSQLEEHCRLITELHHKRDSLGSLLLHASLMNGALAKLRFLRALCAKLEQRKHQGIALLNELHDNSVHGDETIQRCAQQIFLATVEPYINSIKEWILQKRVKGTASSTCDFSHFGCELNAASEDSPKFLTVSTKRLIFKIGMLFKTFRMLINEDTTAWLNSTITQAFDYALGDERYDCVKYNLALSYNLGSLYDALNAYIRRELVQQQILQRVLGQIELFFSYMEDCSERISKRLQPNQVDILMNLLGGQDNNNNNNNNNGEPPIQSWKEVSKHLAKLESIINYTPYCCTSDGREPLVPIYFENDALSLFLVEEGSRMDYLEIFLMLFTFKSHQKAILNCWKDVRNFSAFSRSRWEDEIPEQVKKPLQTVAFKVHQIVLTLLRRASQMHSAVKMQTEAFQKQLLHEVDSLKLNQLHRQFLDAIHKEIKNTISVQLQPILKVVPEFCKHVACFIETTKRTLHSKSDTGWHHDQAKSMQLYAELLVKQGVLQFIDSIPIQ